MHLMACCYSHRFYSASYFKVTAYVYPEGDKSIVYAMDDRYVDAFTIYRAYTSRSLVCLAPGMRQ